MKLSRRKFMTVIGVAPLAKALPAPRRNPITITWPKERALLQWMLDKPSPLVALWGLDDPLNVFEFKKLLGMPS
jgi:hypothetical protein